MHREQCYELGLAPCYSGVKGSCIACSRLEQFTYNGSVGALSSNEEWGPRVFGCRAMGGARLAQQKPHSSEMPRRNGHRKCCGAVGAAGFYV